MSAARSSRDAEVLQIVQVERTGSAQKPALKGVPTAEEGKALAVDNAIRKNKSIFEKGGATQVSRLVLG